MSRLLEGSDLEAAIMFMDAATTLSRKAPCERDQRGVVIVRHNRIIGAGVNAPPQGYACESRYCKPTCKDYAVHAEMNAIANADAQGHSVHGAIMYHARGENGVLQVSRKPKCYACSKHILAFSLGGIVLNHEEGLTLYTAKELNDLSLEFYMKKQIEKLKV